jgi:hypothetical protein
VGGDLGLEPGASSGGDEGADSTDGDSERDRVGDRRML